MILLPAATLELKYKPHKGAAEQKVDRQFCDGGVCANSPTMIAMAFALVIARATLQELFMAVHTTSIKHAYLKLNCTAWVRAASECFVPSRSIIIPFPVDVVSQEPEVQVMTSVENPCFPDIDVRDEVVPGRPFATVTRAGNIQTILIDLFA